MPLPKALTRVNRVFTNRVLGVLGGRVRPFATVIHVGRKSGNTYRTTVLAFKDEDRVAIAMTYGVETDWVRNVLSAGTFRVDLGGLELTSTSPELVGDQVGRPMMPGMVRAALSALDVHDYLVAKVVGSKEM